MQSSVSELRVSIQCLGLDWSLGVEFWFNNLSLLFSESRERFKVVLKKGNPIVNVDISTNPVKQLHHATLCEIMKSAVQG